MKNQKNSLQAEISELQELCKRMEDMEMNESRFNPPATEDEIVSWERTNGITIPESYKEWLRFSNGSQIMGLLARLFSLKGMVVNNEIIPEDMVIIGHLGGSGELLCFSKITKTIVRLFDSEREEYDSFKDIILELIRKGKSILGGEETSKGTMAKLMAKVEAKRNKSKTILEMPRRKKTDEFNKLDVQERKQYLQSLSEAEYRKFLCDIRDQAVQNFWNHERELIKQGLGTRQWTPEQMEAILNVGERGNELLDAGSAIQLDAYENPIVDPHGNTSFYAHHMLDASVNPQFAGEYRNIQALNYNEHYFGAHRIVIARPTNYKRIEIETPIENQGNDLKEDMCKLIELCKRIEEKEERGSWFNPPASEEEILDWECTNGITIPESYKEWLRLSNGSQILNLTARFLSVKQLVTNNKHIPEDLVITGHLIGDGELLCFSKMTGKIVRLFEGRRREFDSIHELISWLIEMAKDTASESGLDLDDEDEDTQHKESKNEENPKKDVFSREATEKLLAIFEAKRNSPEGLTDEQEKLIEKIKSSMDKGD